MVYNYIFIFIYQIFTYPLLYDVKFNVKRNLNNHISTSNYIKHTVILISIFYYFK
jgi:hypothetical protein